jgi:hypothetical protein
MFTIYTSWYTIKISYTGRCPMQDKKVFTPQGKGRIVHRFPDGTLAVEFDHGGGKVFSPEELFPGKVPEAPRQLPGRC